MTTGVACEAALEGLDYALKCALARFGLGGTVAAASREQRWQSRSRARRARVVAWAARVGLGTQVRVHVGDGEVTRRC
jgi:hypothetical protein